MPVYTGFALKYPESWWAAPLVYWEGPLGLRGLTHRVAAVVMIVALAWHIGQLCVSRRLRTCVVFGMLPSLHDAKVLFGTLAYYLRLRRTPPHSGTTFNYAEKAEYLAFMWGSVVMTVTGFALVVLQPNPTIPPPVGSRTSPPPCTSTSRSARAPLRILWRDTAKAQEAATNMKITADDMMRLGIIDEIVREPTGGAHRDPHAAIATTGVAIARAIAELKGQDRETIRRNRRDKFLHIGRTLG